MKSLTAKLLEVQQVVGAIKKETENPFYKSKYFDINKLLSVLKPELNKRGIVLLQPLDQTKEGKPAITTIIADTDSDDSIQFTSAITEIGDAQKMGGSVTYWRRYALQSLFGLEAEDDDGNSLAKKPKAPSKPKGPTPATTKRKMF